MRIAPTLLIVLTLAESASAGTISPEDWDRYCRHYASLAVQDNAANIRMRCGYSGPRWRSDFNAHYNWCMGLREVAGRDTPDADETLLRGVMLTGCVCYQYAREAKKVVESNLSLGCGFSGARWVNSHSFHYDWCTHLPANSTLHISEERARSAELWGCIIRKRIRTRLNK